MQGSVARLSTAYEPTIGDVADKTPQVRDLPPNAAPAAEVERVRTRLERLGIKWHEAVEAAGLSRNTGFTLLRGLGSIASLRRIDEWAAREESRKPMSTMKSQQNKQTEWAALGAELADLDPARFDTMLDGLRDFVKAKRDESGALLKMFHPMAKR